MIGISDMLCELRDKGISAYSKYDASRNLYMIKATKNDVTVVRNVPCVQYGDNWTEHDEHRKNIIADIIRPFNEREYLDHDVESTKKIWVTTAGIGRYDWLEDFIKKGGGIKDMYPRTMLCKFVNEEKENNMNGIEWKVNSVDFSRSGDDKGTIYPHIEGHIYGAYTGDLADIANRLQIKLNRKDADYSTQMSLYEKMCKDYDFAVKVKEAVNRRFGDPRKVPCIEKVIFNDPATIVIWKDGTKTVVKAVNEEFDPEKGLAMAITKKALGNEGNYYNDLKEWLEDYEPKTGLKEGADVIRIKRALEILDRATDRSKVTKADLIASIQMAMGCLCDILDEGSDD